MNVVHEKRLRPSTDIVQSQNISTCTYGIRFNQEGHGETRDPKPNAKHAMHILRRTVVKDVARSTLKIQAWMCLHVQ